MNRPNVQVDVARLTAELERLSRFSDADAPAVTRVLFTDQDLKARAYFRDLCTEAGLAVREDAAGTIFARWIGSDPDLPALGTTTAVTASPKSGWGTPTTADSCTPGSSSSASSISLG